MAENCPLRKETVRPKLIQLHLPDPMGSAGRHIKSLDPWVIRLCTPASFVNRRGELAVRFH